MAMMGLLLVFDHLGNVFEELTSRSLSSFDNKVLGFIAAVIIEFFNHYLHMPCDYIKQQIRFNLEGQGCQKSLAV
jgi:hypothetical protein